MVCSKSMQTIVRVFFAPKQLPTSSLNFMAESSWPPCCCSHDLAHYVERHVGYWGDCKLYGAHVHMLR